MKRIHHLTDARDFRVLFKRGMRLESPLFQCMVRKNGLPYARFAFIAARATEKRAVRRNLLRRRAREWFRTRSALLAAPFDIAVVFKKEAVGSPRKKMYEELDNVTKRIKVWSSSG